MTGRVIFYNTEKRYGFIQAKDFKEDIYFNEKCLYDRDEILKTHNEVSFELTSGMDGRPKAKVVKRIG